MNPIETKEHPIFFTLEVNGQQKKYRSDNVLKLLRKVGQEYTPSSIKTMARLHFVLNEKTYLRFLRVSPMKLMLGNDSRKKMMAKVINSTLGLSGEHLYV